MPSGFQLHDQPPKRGSIALLLIDLYNCTLHLPSCMKFRWVFTEILLKTPRNLVTGIGVMGISTVASWTFSSALRLSHLCWKFINTSAAISPSNFAWIYIKISMKIQLKIYEISPKFHEGYHAKVGEVCPSDLGIHRCKNRFCVVCWVMQTSGDLPNRISQRLTKKF